jgi:hypothetical protein
MGIYREKRNIIKSCIIAISAGLTANSYTNVTCVKSFKEFANVPLSRETKNAVICVLLGSTIRDNVEVGSNSKLRKSLILIHVKGTSGGQVEDLTDMICDYLKNGFTYYEYTVIGGVSTDASFESGPDTDGRIIVDLIDDVPVGGDIDKSQLELDDRFRTLITLHVTKTKVED